MDEKYFELMVEKIEQQSLDEDTMVGAFLRNEKAIPILHEIYTAGRTEQSKRDREAVELKCDEIWNNFDLNDYFCAAQQATTNLVNKKILAALSAAAPKEGE